MKVTRIKPASQGLVRFESTMTFGELVSVRAFNPEALAVKDKENRVLFSLMISSTPKVGTYGMSVEPREPEETITTVFKFEGRSEEEVVALAAGAKAHLTKIERQVKKSLEDYAKAKEEIAEV